MQKYDLPSAITANHNEYLKMDIPLPTRSAVAGKLFVLPLDPHADNRTEDVILVMVITGNHNVTIGTAGDGFYIRRMQKLSTVGAVELFVHVLRCFVRCIILLHSFVNIALFWEKSSEFSKIIWQYRQIHHLSNGATPAEQRRYSARLCRR